MKRSNLILLLLALSCPPLSAQEYTDALMYFCHAGSKEELSESDAEWIDRLRTHPVDINSAGESRLLSCGLFSPYQVASLLDYRSSSGDILSFKELSLVDGFNEEIAAYLKFFVTLSSSRPPGVKAKKGSRHEMTVRAGRKEKGKEPYGTMAFRYHGEFKGRTELFLSSRKTYTDLSLGRPEAGLAVYGKKGKLIVGNFNARFGQGLLVWSGMTMNGFGSQESLCRNPSFLTPSLSWSAAYRGLGIERRYGRWTVSAAASGLDGGSAMGSVSALFRNSQLSVQGITYMKDGPSGGSLYLRTGLGNVVLFAETAYCGTPSAVGGAVWNFAYRKSASILFRLYPEQYDGRAAGAPRTWSRTSDERGAALGCRIGGFNMTADAASHPSGKGSAYKIIADWKSVFNAGKSSLEPHLRFVRRYRTMDKIPLRQDFRAELTMKWPDFSLAGRFDAVHCSKTSWLWYAEAGCRNAIYLKTGCFRIDRWEDRIYVYERDAPGNFNIPFYYGRGMSFSAYAGGRIGKGKRRHSLWMRASAVWYPWTDKAATRELKLQYCFDFST